MCLNSAPICLNCLCWYLFWTRAEEFSTTVQPFKIKVLSSTQPTRWKKLSLRWCLHTLLLSFGGLGFYSRELFHWGWPVTDLVASHTLAVNWWRVPSHSELLRNMGAFKCKPPAWPCQLDVPTQQHSEGCQLVGYQGSTKALGSVHSKTTSTSTDKNTGFLVVPPSWSKGGGKPYQTIETHPLPQGSVMLLHPRLKINREHCWTKLLLQFSPDCFTVLLT